MPGHPDPRLNLAMTLEQAGRIDDATDAYRTALEIYPNHLPTIMGLTRMQVRSGSVDERTEHNLRMIVMRAPDPAWKQWAERELIRLDE
jgi:cytochrome c-type biogenesis protein CcmH/NrfG